MREKERKEEEMEIHENYLNCISHILTYVILFSYRNKVQIFQAKTVLENITLSFNFDNLHPGRERKPLFSIFGEKMKSI